MDSSDDYYSPTQVLTKIWGYPALRGAQESIVPAMLSGRDVLAILPTGGGKSLCFQLPALLHPGTTLVITPLIALMEDQVADLTRRRIAAACFHNELSDPMRRQVLEGMEEGRWTLLYVSPESLLSKDIWSRLGYLNLARLVLDEAHCLATWGNTFRPTYRRLGRVRTTLNLPVAAFTATASPPTLTTIQEVLALERPHTVHLTPYRPHLTLAVTTVWTGWGRRQSVLNFLKAHPTEAGLIYVRSRNTCEELTQYLQDHGFVTDFYHAGLYGNERRPLEQAWLTKKLRFLVCTSAFGMGINHPDLRWVLHYEAPVSTEEYLQEIGRAGRDGKPAQALLIASEPTGQLDPTDRKLHAYFAQQQALQQRQAQTLAQTLPDQGQPTPATASALGLLHQTGALSWETPFDYRLRRAHRPVVTSLPTTHRAMQTYPHTRQCRWQFLLASLGHDHPACGHCDRCHRPR